MPRLKVLSGLACVLVAGCAGSPMGPLGTLDEFTASISDGNVLLHNGSAERVHFALNGAADPNQILWLLCAGPECPGLEPGGQETVPLADLDLGPEATSAYVHWWYAEPDGAGNFRPDSIRTIELTL